MRALNLFDFDNTLSVCDSFLPFLVYSCGVRRFSSALLALGRVRLQGPVSRKEAKEILLSHTLQGRRPEEIETAQFAEMVLSLAMNQELVRKLESYKGERTFIISASPELYLREIARRLNVELLATRLEVDSAGRLTGRLDGENCRTVEKTRRLGEVLNPADYSPIRAFGDSEGDSEILRLANEPYYRAGRTPGYTLRKGLALFRLYRACLRNHSPSNLPRP